MKYTAAFIAMFLVSACATNLASKEDPSATKVTGKVISIFDSSTGQPKQSNTTYTPTGNTAADAAANVQIHGKPSIKRCEYTLITNDNKNIVVKYITGVTKKCQHAVNECVTAWISPSNKYQTIEAGGACTQ